MAIKVKNRLLKAVLVIAGLLSASLGMLGIFLPLLPTTPFLLLAAGCFSKSSEKLSNLLLNNRILGDYLRNYRERNGIPLQAKIMTVSLLWLTIGYSILFVAPGSLVKGILLLIAGGVTLHILKIKTLRVKVQEVQEINQE